MSELEVLIKRLDDSVPMPTYAKGGDAGADLCTTIDFTIAPGERKLIPTGISMALPNGYAAFVHPRSGLAIKSGVSMVNTPGTVDADYRGEIKVLLINHSQEAFAIANGERIAQMVVAAYQQISWIPSEVLSDTERGAGGYGSTGKI